jgi:hypothetical protein
MNSIGEFPGATSETAKKNYYLMFKIRMKREKREEIVRKGVVEHERLEQQFEKKEKELRRQYEELQKRFEEERMKVP